MFLDRFALGLVVIATCLGVMWSVVVLFAASFLCDICKFV